MEMGKAMEELYQVYWRA